MPNHYRPIALALLFVCSLSTSSARAQSSFDERKSQQEQQAIGGSNPLIPSQMQVGFSGSGSAKFLPQNYNGAMAGPTPQPNCTPTVTQVSFNVQCLSNSEVKSASTCRGTMSFFAFNETRNVIGDVSTKPGGLYLLTLHSSADDEIQGCELANVGAVSGSLGNTITMSGCHLSVADCAGDLVGAGGDQALTTSGSVVVAPAQ